MIFGLKNGSVKFPDTEMYYIRFGTGDRNLIMLPGLGDGLRTIKGMALPFGLMYRMFGKDYTVWSFSRKNKMPMGYSIRDMAADLVYAMDQLGIDQADVFGVSMGGMLAQYLAIDAPERVGTLVLAVTAARPNPVLEESVREWIGCAEQDDHTAMMDCNLRRIYSAQYYRRNKWMVPILGKLTKPKSYERFLVMANACLNHHSYDELPSIRSKTLVIGGGKDESLGADAAGEIAGRIPGCELRIFPQWGHGVYEEEPTFNAVVLGFLKKHMS